MDIKTLFYIAFAVVFLNGCVRQPVFGPGVGEGAAYTPVVDGPQDEVYYRDLRQCRALAARVQQQQQAGANEDALIGGLAGGLLGALAGSTEGSDEALIGGLVGTAIGAASTTASTVEGAENSGKTIITRCMQNRGHNVLL